MATLFAFLLAAVALAVGSMRPDSPAARSGGRVLDDLKAAGWRRVARLVAFALLGGAAIALYAAVRTGLYGAMLAIAALACAAASIASMDRRPVRIRLEIAR